MKKAEKLAREIFSDADLEAVSAAIKSFEKRTSGEIVISFNTTSHNQPYKTARRIFQKAGLHKTRERNATLIVLYLPSRNLLFSVMPVSTKKSRLISGKPRWPV